MTTPHRYNTPPAGCLDDMSSWLSASVLSRMHPLAYRVPGFSPTDPLGGMLGRCGVGRRRIWSSTHPFVLLHSLDLTTPHRHNIYSWLVREKPGTRCLRWCILDSTETYNKLDISFLGNDRLMRSKACRAQCTLPWLSGRPPGCAGGD